MFERFEPKKNTLATPKWENVTFSASLSLSLSGEGNWRSDREKWLWRKANEFELFCLFVLSLSSAWLGLLLRTLWTSQGATMIVTCKKQCGLHMTPPTSRSNHSFVMKERKVSLLVAHFLLRLYKSSWKRPFQQNNIRGGMNRASNYSLSFFTHHFRTLCLV